MGSLSDWSDQVPSDDSFVKDGANLIRSDKSIVQQAIQEEHYFEDSASSTGIHKPGSARPYYGPSSDVSEAADDGRLMVTSDTSEAWHVGAAGAFNLVLPINHQVGLGISPASMQYELTNTVAWDPRDEGSDSTDKVWVIGMRVDTHASNMDLPVQYDGLPFVLLSAHTDTSNVGIAISAWSLSDRTVWSSATDGFGVSATANCGVQILSIGTISRSSLSF